MIEIKLKEILDNALTVFTGIDIEGNKLKQGAIGIRKSDGLISAKGKERINKLRDRCTYFYEVGKEPKLQPILAIKHNLATVRRLARKDAKFLALDMSIQEYFFDTIKMIKEVSVEYAKYEKKTISMKKSNGIPLDFEKVEKMYDYFDHCIDKVLAGNHLHVGKWNVICSLIGLTGRRSYEVMISGKLTLLNKDNPLYNTHVIFEGQAKGKTVKNKNSKEQKVLSKDRKIIIPVVTKNVENLVKCFNDNDYVNALRNQVKMAFIEGYYKKTEIDDLFFTDDMHRKQVFENILKDTDKLMQMLREEWDIYNGQMKTVRRNFSTIQMQRRLPIHGYQLIKLANKENMTVTEYMESPKYSRIKGLATARDYRAIYANYTVNKFMNKKENEYFIKYCNEFYSEYVEDYTVKGLLTQNEYISLVLGHEDKEDSTQSYQYYAVVND